jgi:erythronate-4-phosphate dehydrogenase
MKIIADENIPFVREAFKEIGNVVTLPGRDIRRGAVLDADILLVRSVTPVNAVLLEGSSVKFVATATIGVDHIDTTWLNDNAIGFASAPGSNADSVAEYVTAALLHIELTQSYPLKGKTIGIIGVGNVGSRVMKKAEALGMRCLLNDPPKQRQTGSDLFVPLDTILKESDIVTLHVPLISDGEDATYNMVNDRFFTKIKDKAVLFNTCRGDVVDEAALRAHRARLKVFVSDVWHAEPSISMDTLRAADIATPHIAGYSYDGKVRGTEMIYQAACAFFFKEARWLKESHLGLPDKHLIDISTSVHPVHDAVMAAYPIMQDDAALRKISDVPPGEQGSYFDGLRKKYPRRREFFAYTVKASGRRREEINLCAALGFNVI